MGLCEGSRHAQRSEGLLTGGIIIKNSQDSFVPGEQGKDRNGGSCEVTAKGGDV